MKINTPVVFLIVASLCPDAALADTFGNGVNGFEMEFVTIGDPGNAGDADGGVHLPGAVPYVYRIGKFEVSESMIAKANALGGLGITTNTRGADKPAMIPWNEAARFVNWLNTSAGFSPAYKFAVQPGENDYHPNVDIELWQPGDAGYNPDNLYRNSLAHYVLPSADEWHS